MITVRPSSERGHADHGWLQSKHTFSFADYYDPKHVSFRALRVINEDWVAGGKGFGMHPHKDMEILTWVRSGRLEHADTMQNRKVIHPGELQVMSAGTGLFHSEYNPDATETVHLFQTWIYPDRRGIEPRYDQKMFDETERRGKFQLLASSDGREGSLMIHADAALSAVDLAAGETAGYALEAGRGAWLQVARGSVKVNGVELKEGDGAAVENESAIAVEATEAAHVMLFDLK
jgi:redox-sensitive bicupin YhaK (pirin superfamily)